MTMEATQAAPAAMDLSQAPSPCYVCDAAALARNAELLEAIQDRTGCRILLALKGFAMFSAFPIIRNALTGTTASSLNEARLGHEEFGGEVHAYAPAYRPDEFGELLQYASHVTFNSFSQWERFRDEAKGAAKPVSRGLRINPRHSEVLVDIYNPCGPGSRLGVTPEAFAGQDLTGLDGLHFHTLCGLGADALERTLRAVEARFAPYLGGMKWVNFGGGHHITRPDYDVELLTRLISGFQERYGVQVYLEPGEAVALNAGVLMATVLDIVENDMPVAILDTSATAHMPDVLEMPYRPEIIGAGQPGAHSHTYRLGGVTCLAGDVIGDYSFPQPLEIGQRLVFTDMLHYTMVKNTAFNGLNLPAIAIHDSESGETRVVREFGYADYKSRLS